MMSETGIQKAAQSVKQRVQERWGTNWHSMLSEDMRRVVVSGEAMALVMRWGEPDRLSAADVQRVTEAAHGLMFGTGFRG